MRMCGRKQEPAGAGSPQSVVNETATSVSRSHPLAQSTDDVFPLILLVLNHIGSFQIE